MKYKLEFENYSKETVIGHYEPMSGEMLLGEEFNEELFLRPLNDLVANSTGKKSTNVDVLKIQLGLSCNYSCSYCLQSSEIDKAAKTKIDDAMSFIENLDSWLDGTPSRIEFWGGEPLLYLKKLNILVPALRNRFPDARLVIISNGSLLNDEVVDFLIDYDINFAISHDGPGQAARGPDPLFDPTVSSAIKRLLDERKEKFSFNFMVGGHNKSLKSIVTFFRAMYGDDVPLNVADIVTPYSSDVADSEEMSDEELLSFSDELFYEMVDIGFEALPYDIHQRMNRFLKHINGERNLAGESSKCGMDTAEYLSCDLEGNVITCQNVGAVGVHMAGKVDDMSSVNVTEIKHWSDRKACKDCIVLSICGGGCMYQSDTLFESACRAHFAYSMAVLRFFMFINTGLVLKTWTELNPNKIEVANVD